MKRVLQIFLVGACLLSMVSCATIRPGEAAVKQTFGKLQPKIYGGGLVGYNPFVTRLVRVPTQTVNLEVKLALPSQDGLNIASEISILYRILPEFAPSIISNIGMNYETTVVLSVFRSASADVCSRFLAKDMYTAKRAEIESAIKDRMMELLAKRGFEIEAVLLKSIVLPTGLASAIEEKLEAEQSAQRMEFELQRERMEAQRKIIEAEGVRDAQLIIEQGLSPKVVEWRSIEVFEKLATSPNAKIIITDGNSPLLIDSEPQSAPASPQPTSRTTVDRTRR
ncbi:MAG: prohibitin family protein [Bacteroidia bacterium]